MQEQNNLQEISAGGIVYKKDGQRREVLLIEDRHGKVTIPKGKQETGETLPETAIREIEEETGIIGDIIERLEKVHYTYTDPKRGHINKEVTYYLVEASGGLLQAQLEEINRVYWLEKSEAWELHQKKGYANNHAVFTQAMQLI